MGARAGPPLASPALYLVHPFAQHARWGHAAAGRGRGRTSAGEEMRSCGGFTHSLPRTCKAKGGVDGVESEPRRAWIKTRYVWEYAPRHNGD